MKVQVLVAAMNQTDHSLLDTMNIQTDALIGNQTDHNNVDRFIWKGHEITYYSFQERGVGLNRNNTLMRADCDVCLFADDDMVYFDDYQNTVNEAFNKNPKADIIIFNIDEKDSKRYIITKKTKVRWYNFMRYGAVRIAAKLSSIKENAIFFNQCFGGGAKYRHGEDTLFLAECLRKKLKIVAIPVTIAHLTNERPSTWNVGYDDRYLQDQGKLYSVISKRWWKLICFQDAFRHRRLYNRKTLMSYKIMKSWQHK